jgi:hypothetical protein
LVATTTAKRTLMPAEALDGAVVGEEVDFLHGVQDLLLS